MRRLLAVLAVLAAAATSLVACGDDGPAGPPAIEYGRDVCTDCNMIISDARFAAAYRDGSGESSIFDDIGDLLRHGHAEGVLDEVTAWVHDYDTQAWVEADTAWFVRGDVQTPMASGLVAFAGERDARAFAEKHEGEVMRWDDLVTAAADVGRHPMMGNDDGDGG